MSDHIIPFLGARTHFSLMTGAASPERVCAFAQSAGYRTLALNDANNLHALPDFVDAAEAAGLKAIAGASIENGERNLCRLWCLDRRGFSRLCHILSNILSNAGANNYDPVADLVENGWAGLAIASEDASVLERLATVQPDGGMVRGSKVKTGTDHGFENFWSRPFVAVGCAGGSILAARLAARLGLPSIALAGGTVFDNDDGDRLELLSAVSRRITLSALPDNRARLKSITAPSAAEVAASFSAFPAALEAARRLAAEAASAREFFSTPPVFPPYRGMNEASAYSVLRSLCARAASRRYPPDGLAHPGVADRLRRELEIIRSKGFASYFLVVRDIVATCPRTCGRGSAASSIVSYLLGLTHVDPLAHDLFFERFLNEGRMDPPDIDVDFPWDERPAVLQRVFRDYAGQAAMVADHCRFSGRSKVREAALALGKNLDEVDKLVGIWRHGGTEALPPELARASALLADVPRYIGTHPGGVVITPGPIRDYTHVQPSPAGLPVLAWEKDGTERAGLVKIDLLGNRSLAVLRDCINLVTPGHQLPGSQISVASGQQADGILERPAKEARCVVDAEIQPNVHAETQTTVDAESPELAWEHFNPLLEPSARALIEAGTTIGIFYIESPATRQLLGKMRTADYEHLVVASSIIRPAANSYINEYVRRLHGAPWPRLAAAAEETLVGTHGIMVYQEDVSRVAMAAAGFTAVEADGLRKALTKKRKGLAISSFRERFMAGCASRGVPAADADKLWDMMLSFDGYSFCKAHSASYALVSYRLAWMKANHPGIFIVSVINNGGGFYGIQTYVDEAARLGYTVLPPDVNHSELKYVVSQEKSGPSSRPASGLIRAGLMQIIGLDRDTACSIVAERQNKGGYTGFTNFLARIKPSYDDCRVLVRSGALDGQGSADGGLSRPAMLWVYHHWRRSAQQGATRVGSPELFSAWHPPACIHDYTASAKLADESTFLGVLLSIRPAALFAGRARQLAAGLGWPAPVLSSELAVRVGKLVCVLGVATAGKDVMASSGQLMCFRSFTDESGVFETVLFPQAYTRLMPILEGNSAFLLLGVPKDDLGALAIHVDDMVALNRVPRYRG